MANKDEGQFELDDLFRLIWRNRWLVALFTLVFGVGAATASLLLPRQFEAVAVLAPVSDKQGGLGALGSIASQIGGIASLAGISLGSGGGNVEAIATLRSDNLTREFIRRNNLLPILFAKKWDRTTNAWKVAEPPTLWDAVERFKKLRTIDETSKNGLVTLTITWTNADQAAQWANGLVALANSYLRDRTIAESERDIAYLQDQAAKTNIIELRNSIYSLTESEIKKIMVARGSDEYSLRVIDRALPPEKQSSPLPAIWTALGLICGAFISVLFLLVRPPSKSRPSDANASAS